MNNCDENLQISIYKNVCGLKVLICKITASGVQARGIVYPWEAVIGIAEFPEKSSIISRNLASACLVFADGKYIRLTPEQKLIGPGNNLCSYADLLREVKSRTKDFNCHVDKIPTMPEEKFRESIIVSNVLFAAVLFLFLYGGGLNLAMYVAPLNMIALLFLIPTLVVYNRKKRDLCLSITGQKQLISS